MDEVLKLLNEIGLPFAYDHFAEGESPEPPFICYLMPRSENFSADGKVYFKVDAVHIEVYTDMKDPVLEQRIEKILDDHEFFYQKSEVWINSEKLYEVVYSMEVINYGKQSEV